MGVGTGTVGRVAVDFVLNHQAFETGLRVVEDRVSSTLGSIVGVGERVDRALSRIGTRLTVGITLPVAGAAVALSRMGATFDQTLTRIGTLANATESEVESFRAAVLKLAPAVAQTPTGLAEGLLAITSAGVRGQQALDVLERSAKAATVGLGDTQTVARLVSAALQAYGSSGLTATRATDVLVASVRAGAAEADQMAGALGNVIGLASQVGVSFEQVAAFVATFTRVGVSADEAVTALRGALLTILSPSDQAAQALRAVGLSSEVLRQQIRERGLAETFIGLVNTFRGNEEGLAAIVENVRALSGVLSTAGAQADAFRGVLEEITGSAGILDETFARTAERPAFTFQQFRVAAETTATAVGDKLAPALARVMRALDPVLSIGGAAVQIFAALPLPIQSTAIALGAMAVAAGPLILLMQGLVKVIGSLIAISLLIRLGPIFLQIARAVAPAVNGISAIRGAIAALPSPIAAAATTALTLVSALHPLGLLIGPIASLAARLISFHPTVRAVGIAALALGAALGGVGIATKGLAGSSQSASTGLQTMGQRIEDVGEQARSTKGLIERLNEEANRVGSGQPPTATPTPNFPPPSAIPPPVGGFFVPPTSPGSPTPTPTPPPIAVPLSGLAVPRQQASIAQPQGFVGPAAPLGIEKLDNASVTQTLREARAELAQLDVAAKFLPPTFDLVAAKAGVIEAALKKAAVEGLQPTSVEGQKLAGELAALTTDSTQLNREMTAIAASGRLTGDNFGAWQQQVGHLESQISQLISNGFNPADPAIQNLQARLDELVDTGPPLEDALARIADEGAAVGPTFDVAGRSAAFLRGALESLAARGVERNADVMVLMQREVTRLSGDTAQLALQLESSAQRGLLFGDSTATVQEQVRLARGRLDEMSDALTAARLQLGEADPAVIKLAQDVQKLRDRLVELNVEAARITLGDQLEAISRRSSVAKAFPSPGQTGVDVDLAAAGQRLEARRQQRDAAVNLPPATTPQEATARQEFIIEQSSLIQAEERALRTASVIQGTFQTVADSIGQAFDRSALGVIQGTESINQAFANLGQSILLSWGSALTQKAATTAAHWAAEKAIWLAGELGLISIQQTGAGVRGAITAAETTVATTAKAGEVSAAVAGEAIKTAATTTGSAARTSLTLTEVAFSIGAKITEVATWVAGEASKLTASVATFAVAIAGTALLAARTLAYGAAMAIALISTLAMMVAAPILSAVAIAAAASMLVYATALKAVAISGAASAVASIPYAGPALAVAAAASVGAAISAAAAVPIITAAGGAALDRDQLVMAHARETILPARYRVTMDNLSALIGPGRLPEGAPLFGTMPTLRAPRPTADLASEMAGAGYGGSLRPSSETSEPHIHLHLEVTDKKGVKKLLRNNGRELGRIVRERFRDFDPALRRG